MVETYPKIQTAGMQYMRVEFSPNEPGIPFGDNLAHQVSLICRQFGDSRTPALPPIRLLPVTNLDNLEPVDLMPRLYEVVDLTGDLIELELN
jgi:hypothetical protein